MGSFEWMEVETLSTEIAVLDSRLTAAKSRNNYGLVKVVQEQIAAAQQRRAQYLAHITTSLAESLDPAPLSETAPAAQPGKNRALSQKNQEELAAPDQPSAELADPVMAEVPEELAEPDQPSAELADPVMAEVPEELAEPDQPSAELAAPVTTSGVASPFADTNEGVTDVWDQLTPSHIERAKHELGIRRAEMLARHAEELKVLDVDQSEIDTLTQAIDAFVRKFNSPAAANSVIRLDEERDRLQNQA